MTLELVLDARARSIGAFDVQRVLPERRRRHVGPFVFLDHMGPARLAPGNGFDVLPHPHIGLATVTYLFSGEEVHRDSLGNVQTIAPGAVNLMAAGRGIVHSERSSAATRAAGAVLHGLQLWVALPIADEDAPPRFQHVPAEALPRVAEPGVEARVLVGAALGVAAPTADTSGAVMIDLILAAGARFAVPRELEEAALYIAEGEVEADGARHGAHQLLVVAPGTELVVTATQPTRAAVIGGRPLDAPRVMDWNFVASTRDRIERAKAVWRAQERGGQFPRIPGDADEFVPYPSLTEHR